MSDKSAGSTRRSARATHGAVRTLGGFSLADREICRLLPAALPNWFTWLADFYLSLCNNLISVTIFQPDRNRMGPPAGTAVRRPPKISWGHRMRAGARMKSSPPGRAGSWPVAWPVGSSGSNRAPPAPIEGGACAWCRSVCRCLAFFTYRGNREHGTGPKSCPLIVARSTTVIPQIVGRDGEFSRPRRRWVEPRRPCVTASVNVTIAR